MEIIIDADQFYSRLDAIKNHWLANKGDMWEGADALCIPMGSVKDQDVVYSKSSSLHLYLLGYEFPDSLLVLTPNKLFFMATQKKIAFIDSIKDDNKFTIVTLVKSKDDAANRENFKIIINEIKGSGGKKLGTLLKGDFEGRFVPSWNDAVQSDLLDTVEIGRGLGYILSIKDAAEQEICKRAAVLTKKVLKHGFVEEMEEIIDKNKKVSHDKIAEKIESLIHDPSKINVKVSRDVVESCFTPIIQSGGDYDIKVSAQSNSSNLKFDVILCSLGARYRNYCGNVSRTFLVDPPRKISETYGLLMNLMDTCLERMIVGNQLKDVMEGAKAFLQRKAPELIPHLPKNLGFAIGIEFRDGTMVLNNTNTTSFRAGMVFNLSVGLQNVTLEAADKNKVSSASDVSRMDKFSLLVADTVCVQAEGVPDVLTKADKALSEISYIINSENDGDENGGYEDPLDALENDDGDRVRRSARGKEDKAEQEKNNLTRQSRQKELMEMKIKEAQKRATKGSGSTAETEVEATELAAYPSTEHYPKDVTPHRLKVDMQSEAVLVPMNGQVVPFHISTIKNVSMPEPDRATYLRINFYSTGMALGKDAPKNMQHLISKYGDQSSFIRELTFRSLDPKNLTLAYRNILELRKRLRQSEQKAEEEKDLVKQEKLIRIRDERVPLLKDLTMRPQLSGRKSAGNLAAHQNGLRFTTTKGEIVDVMYANIKHAFFEPCDKSTLVLVHFHLKDFILIGKKKQKDIQFFTEVISASLNLDNQRRSAYDPDEYDEEQRERELRNKLNKNFLEFCKKVEKVAKHYEFDLTFDVPYSDLGFFGSCAREMVFIQPSVSCLINLTEMPFFIVDMSEIDHVHFERVTYATKNFDMVLIFKNFDLMPRMITAIELKYLETIQDWLCDVQITYTSGPQSFAWKGVMESAKEDERFYLTTDEDGEPKAWKDVGWNVLTAEVEGDDSEEESDGDSSYGNASEGESSEEESDEDSDGSDESFEEEESDGSYDEEAEDELEEEGMSWEELEKDAAISDRTKRMNGGEEETSEHSHMKKKARR